jgi:hypothetical protein
MLKVQKCSSEMSGTDYTVTRHYVPGCMNPLHPGLQIARERIKLNKQFWILKRILEGRNVRVWTGLELAESTGDPVKGFCGRSNEYSGHLLSSQVMPNSQRRPRMTELLWSYLVYLSKPNGFLTYHQVYHSKILHGARYALSFLYGSQNRQRPLIYTLLTDWFL